MRISDWSSDVCSSDLIRTRCSGVRYIFSPGLTSNALYQGSRLRTVAARCSPGECGLARSCERSAGSRYLVRHTRSEEHTSELQSLMRISYAVFCLKKKRTNTHTTA